FSFNTYEEALEYLRKMHKENITLEKGIELYRQYLLSRKQNARVVNEILLFLRPFVRILGNISFNEVTEQKLQYYIFRRLQEKSNRTGQYISEQTIKRELTTLSACWNFLLRNGYINTQNFAYKILKEKKFSDKKRERVLSYEENIRFLKAVMELGDDRYNNLVGYLTGARRDEIFRLRKEHVRIIKNGDVFSGMIHFTGDITKTGKPRKIDIPYSFALFLLNIQPGSIYVFPDYQTEYAQKKFSNWFHKEFLKKAGIENFVFHDLRHNWATISEEVGASVLMIKALGGWNSMNSVGRYINPTRIEQNPMNKFLAVLIKEFQEKDKLDGGKDEM
ncbi:MAG: site-specific integrase, partial [Candidatus Aenigmatarchaeota archaeon]